MWISPFIDDIKQKYALAISYDEAPSRIPEKGKALF
jgi:hypothetical protein